MREPKSLVLPITPPGKPPLANACDTKSLCARRLLRKSHFAANGFAVARLFGRESLPVADFRGKNAAAGFVGSFIANSVEWQRERRSRKRARTLDLPHVPVRHFGGLPSVVAVGVRQLLGLSRLRNVGFRRCPFAVRPVAVRSVRCAASGNRLRRSRPGFRR